MKTSTFFTFMALGAPAAIAVYALEPCDMATIQGKLFANATEGLAKCEDATGIDVFSITEFPTEAETQVLFQTEDCVNYINQINQVANEEINCDIQLNGTTVVYADLLTALLEGRTGNETESELSSGSVEFPDSNSDSQSDDSAEDDTSATGVESSSTSGAPSMFTSAFSSAVAIVALISAYVL